MRLAVIDTETTGLPKHPSAPLNKQPKIIEFAARVVTEDGPTDETLSFLANPREPLEPIITKITGLTDEDLKDEPGFAHYIVQVQEFFASCHGIAAHNCPFDSGMIWFEVRRAQAESDWQWPSLMVCTTQYYRPKFGYRPKLPQLYQHITGEKLAQTHRALDDVDALCEIISSGEVIETLSAIEATDGVYFSSDICPG